MVTDKFFISHIHMLLDHMDIDEHFKSLGASKLASPIFVYDEMATEDHHCALNMALAEHLFLPNLRQATSRFSGFDSDEALELIMDLALLPKYDRETFSEFLYDYELYYRDYQ